MADSYVRAALRLFFINKFISVARNSGLSFFSDTCLTTYWWTTVVVTTYWWILFVVPVTLNCSMFFFLVISPFWKEMLFNCQTECLRSIQRICLITMWIFFQFFNPDTFGLHFWAVILLLKINIIGCWLIEPSTRYTTIIEGNFVRLKTNNIRIVCYNVSSSQFQLSKQLVRVNLSEN